ncbi:hypothetical protein HG535_0A06980 [Zygotorulaspora mrakii]|uniref:Uncharacterized protein n=1 Tax=Zygotorulaspora mrakii TaxID=42260 RepID=A0A7H9AWT0_ZYGMR|nr:uncharacterized protein HG535_0A06980 [Zygotorulaspora mrakii]QLG70756.1 hypothetical protein HG535_0A06980 [Zygotorulaspora mrakii]
MYLQEVVTITMNRPRMPLRELSSSRINKIGNTHAKAKKAGCATALPSIKSLIDCTTTVSASVTVPKAIEPQEKLSREELNEIAKKLRVRLQFAYFKLKNNQTGVKFRELQRQKQREAEVPVSHSIKRRKLLVNHGNLKTPARSRLHEKALGKTDTANTSVDSSILDEKSSQNFLKFYHNTTPLGKSSLTSQQCQKQDTPMSVKAAKSLLHLFTSSQQ